MMRRAVIRYGTVFAGCIVATALMAWFTEGAKPLALLGWMAFFISLHIPALWNADEREIFCARWLRRGRAAHPPRHAGR
jgi:hypothetical protein